MTYCCHVLDVKIVAEADPDFELGWFPVPDKNGKFNLVGGAGKGGWSLYAETAKNPDKKAGFEAFIKYFFSKEVYGIFLEALSFFPTTVEAPDMKVTPLLQKVIDAANDADYLSPMWNGKVGYHELPPDYRNYTYKTVVEVLNGIKTVDQALKELDETWEIYTQEFNPVTGAGIN
jgi:raffinose/stachyose/melibiose transport system substrate-binding protein